MLLFYTFQLAGNSMNTETAYGCLLCGTSIDDPPSQCSNCGAVSPAGITGDTTLNDLMARLESSVYGTMSIYLKPVDENYFLIMAACGTEWKPGFLVSRNGSPVTPEIVDEVAGRAGFTVVVANTE